jgi:outer membrane protein OmpA-like peptidoglycan-associated protein
MNIPRMRSGLLAGPVFIAALMIMVAAGAARAACADLVQAFDKAVAERRVDAAISGLTDIGGNPTCMARLAEYRTRLVDFLIDYAGTPELAAADRDKAIANAERIVEASANWRAKARLGDYHFTRGDRPGAFEWYLLSASNLLTPGVDVATDKERKELMARLVASWSLVRDYNPRFTFATTRCPCGTFSDVLLHLAKDEAALIPFPVQFAGEQATFTPAGERVVKELTEMARQMRTIKLIGHVAARERSSVQSSDLSQRRVLAVRDALLGAGVTARITVEWKGGLEPFDVSALPDPGQLSKDDIWQLDDRIEVVRTARE